MAHRLTVRPSKHPVMTIHRRAVKARKLVYLICAPRSQKYPRGRSRIIYIGTTQAGVHRMASSMAHKAIVNLDKRGVRSLDVYLLTCRARPGLQSWKRLEQDLLIAFKIAYGRVPVENTSGKNYSPDRLSGFFQYRRLTNVLSQYDC